MSVLKYWNSESFDITNYKWFLSERKYKRFTTSGSDNSNLNTYTYNSLGYRGDEFPLIGKKIMAVGCSHTEGIGVNDDETWPHYLSKLLNHSHINFGFTGRSNDYISRCILTFIEEIQPDIVCIMYTYPNRREYYTEDGGVEPFHITPWGYFEHNLDIHQYHVGLTNLNEDFINWYKNHLLITNFLKNKNIPYIWNGIFLNTEYDDGYRFDGEYHIEYGTHATPEQNKIYATKLYKELIRKKYGIKHIPQTQGND
jgi:hypothetical protein